VLLAVCQEFGIDKDINPAIANLFAGGIGNTGSVCGAVSGAVMAIGLKRGRGEGMEQTMANLAVAQEFRRRYEAEMETISCAELTGVDLTTPEGMQQMMTSEEIIGTCFTSVGVAYKLAVNVLKESE
jgi:C_GCAxxG_C_C family probable redox protein